jgi:hypothetical protein
MLPFLIAFLIALALPRPALLNAAIVLVVVGVVISGLQAWGLTYAVNPNADKSSINQFLLLSCVLTAVEIIIAFLLAWGLRRLIFRKKATSER